MKSSFVKGVVFISKSLLWSVLLYAACMLTVNWNNLYYDMKHHTQHDVVEHTSLLPQVPVAAMAPNAAPQINTIHATFLSDIATTAAGVRNMAWLIASYVTAMRH